MNKVAKILSYITFVFAFCFMAIGYAAVQDTLNVSGSVSIELQIKPFAVYGTVYDSEGTPLGKALNFYNRPIVEANQISCGEGSQDVSVLYTDIATLALFEADDQPWKEIRTEIERVEVIDEDIQPTNMSYWFSGFNSCTYFNLNNFNTSKVTDMVFMFDGCSAVQTLDLTGFVTSKVTGDGMNTGGMECMFRNCTALIELNISSFNTSYVGDIAAMFDSCSLLETIYVGEEWNVDHLIERMGDNKIFDDCTALVGGNKTAYNDKYSGQNYKDIEYARLDLPGQAGYFTYGGYMLLFDNTYGDGSYSLAYKLDPSSTIKLPDTLPTFTGANFLGWKTADADTLYQANEDFTFDSESTSKTETLYAVFDLVTNLQAQKLVDKTGQDYTITGDYASRINITDSDTTDGRKVVTIKDTSTSYAGNQSIFVDGADVIIEDFTVDDSADGDGNSGYIAVYVKNGGTVTIKGGYYNKASIVGGDKEKNSKVIIEGGVFSGYGDFNGLILGGFFTQFELDNIIIRGGTFSSDPSQYVEPGYVAVQNGDGTWTVVCKHTDATDLQTTPTNHKGTCAICGEFDEPHKFDDQGICRICGYEVIVSSEQLSAAIQTGAGTSSDNPLIIGGGNWQKDVMWTDLNPDTSKTIYITIYGGEFPDWLMYLTNVHLVIEDGIFTSNDDAPPGNRAFIASGNSSIAIKGGDWSTITQIQLDLGTSTDISFEITGGTFGFDVSQWVPDGYVVDDSNGTYKVVPAG